MTTDRAAPTSERLDLGVLPSGTPITTTVHRYGSPASGPTVYLQALQHGREVNGVEVLRRLHGELRQERLHGQVIAVPVANPISFDHRRYLAPPRLDALNANMNRLWPGDPEGTLIEQMVARLWTIACDADVIVDLHTGAPTMLSHTRYSPGDARSRELAAAFGLDVILEDGEGGENGNGSGSGSGNRDGGGEEDGNEFVDGNDGDATTGASTERGKLREIATRRGIPSITPELAHSRTIVEDSVERGVLGVENVLSAVGVLDGTVPEQDPLRATDRTRIFARESGLFRAADVEVGDRVTTDTVVGRVYDPATFEVLQTVEAGRDGMLLTCKRGFAVINGEALASVVAVP